MKINKIIQNVLLIAVLLLTSVFTPGLSLAADEGVYYVSSAEGSDLNPGTLTEPFATLNHAISMIVAEGTIVLQDDITLGTALAIAAAGKTITITSDGNGPHSIIRDEGYAGTLIQISNGTVIFDSLIIDGNGVEEVNAYGIYSEGLNTVVHYRNAQIRNHHITGTGRAVIMTYNGATTVMSEGARISDNTLSGTGGTVSQPNPPAILGAGNCGTCSGARSETQIRIVDALVTNNMVAEGSNGVIVGMGLNHLPIFWMTGGEIKGNSLNGDSAEPTYGNVAVFMRGSAAQAEFRLGGTAYVYDNTNEAGEQRNVYLRNTAATGSAYLTLTDPMAAGARVGVFANIMPDQDTIPMVDVAIGKAPYTATKADAGYFVSDKATTAIIDFDEDGHKVILAYNNGPGGAVNPQLWLRADANVVLDADESTVGTWTDMSRGNVFEKAGASARYPQFAASGANFNPVISFNNPPTTNHYGNSGRLDGTNEVTFQSGYAVTKQTTGALVGSKEVLPNNGVNILGSVGQVGDNLMYTVGTGRHQYWRGFSTDGSHGYDLTFYEIEEETSHYAAVNGRNVPIDGGQNWFEAPLTFTPVLGASPAGSNTAWRGLQGEVAEIILFDRETSGEEQARIQSYLALKYGITLNEGNSDYVDSEGNVFWDAGDNAGYGNRITGIGRDEGGSQYQKQSKSAAEAANVTIALGEEVAESNQANTNRITNDSSFFVFGDNGNDASYDADTVIEYNDGQLKQMARVYKVDKTAWADQDITLVVDDTNDGIKANYLILSAVDTFDSDLEFHEIIEGQVTLDSSKLADGSFFTFGSLYSTHTDAELLYAIVDPDHDSIELTFDYPVTLENLAGFTLTIGETTTEPVDLTGAIFSLDEDGNKLTIHLPEGELTVEEDGFITLTYNGEGTLRNAWSNYPVSAFEGEAAIKLVNKFALQAGVNEASGLIEAQYTPESWGPLQAALIIAQEVLADPSAGQQDVDDAWAALKAAYDGLVTAAVAPKLDSIAVNSPTTVELAFDQPVQLDNPNGFTVKVNGATVTETVYTVAGNTLTLTLAVPITADDEVSVHYDDATESLRGTNGLPVASFDADAVNQLEVDKTALQAEVGLAEFLNEDDYTADSWEDYQEQLTYAQTTLANPAATQSEVSIALLFLQMGRNALIPVAVEVDKAALQAEADAAGELTGADYTPASWNAYQAALSAAEAVLADADATQAEVNAALAQLLTAKAYLELVAIGTAPQLEAAAMSDPTTVELIFDLPVRLDNLTGFSIAVNDVTVTANTYGAEGSRLTITLPVEVGQDDIVAIAYDGTGSLAGETGLPVAAFSITASYDAGVDKSALQARVNEIEAESLNAAGYTQESWQDLEDALRRAREELDNPHTTQSDVNSALGALNMAREFLMEAPTGELGAIQLTNASGATINLSPVFEPGRTEYTASVPYSTSTIRVEPTPAEDGTSLTMFLNGVEVDAADWGALPLRVGRNIIEVNVYDHSGELLNTYTIEITRSASSGGGYIPPVTPVTPVTPAVPEEEAPAIEVTVDGEDDPFAGGTVSESAGRQVTEVEVDSGKLDKVLAQEDRQDLVIHSPNEGDMTVSGLTESHIRTLADTNKSLTISSRLAIYPIPGGDMDHDAISALLGDAAPEDIEVYIAIARASASLIANAQEKAAAEGYELLVDPVTLDMTFAHDGVTIRTELLRGYAPKYIALPDGIDPNRITTGVIVYPDGTVYHVPTVVTRIDNRYFALINDLHSHGTYSVIWNPKDFDDVRGHWGQEDIHNIAARLDLNGYGHNIFMPDRDITRAEFAEIVVIGLGLRGLDVPDNSYPDVAASAWFRDSLAIASEFGIVKGYDNGLFAGNQEITREQGIAMIARAYRLIAPQPPLSEAQIHSLLEGFRDASGVAEWAREDVALLIQDGIVEGQGEQLLNPQANITRAEVAALVARLLKSTGLIDN